MCRSDSKSWRNAKNERFWWSCHTLLLIKLSKMWPELQHSFSCGRQQAINTGSLSAYTCAAAWMCKKKHSPVAARCAQLSRVLICSVVSLAGSLDDLLAHPVTIGATSNAKRRARERSRAWSPKDARRRDALRRRRCRKVAFSYTLLKEDLNQENQKQARFASSGCGGRSTRMVIQSQ
jgi:hypothetical protein